MNNKKLYAWMAVGAIVLVAALVLVLGGRNSAAPASGGSAAEAPITGPLAHVVVVYRDDGFSPATLEVTAPTMVVFQADASSTKAFQPASNSYPNSGKDKCGKVGDGSNFNACEPVRAGTVSSFWPFVLREKGTWAYYNSLDPSQVGTITVK